MKYNYLIILAVCFMLSSCQQEETQITETDDELEFIVPGSQLSQLITAVSLNDGSYDNAVDSTSRLAVIFPIEVELNGSQQTIFSAEEIEAQMQSYTDSFEIIFPISVITSDYTEVVIENYTQLQAYQQSETENDIECVDFSYPFSFSAYNTETETFETIVIESDAQLFAFVQILTPEILVSLDYPVSITFADGTELTINSNLELEDAILDFMETCDEDDDPYNQEGIVPALIGCQWDFSQTVGTGTISFLEDGSLGGYSTTLEYFFGTWNLQIGNEDILTIDITGYEIEVEGSWIVSGFYAGESGYYLSLNEGQMILEQDCPLQTSCSTTITACEMGTEVGYAEFNLSEQDECMMELAGMEPETSAVYYYLTEMDAMNGTNTLFPESFINTTQFSQYVYVRIENINTGFYELIVILLVTEDC